MGAGISEAGRRLEKTRVRTFLYSMRIGTPVERLHVITKVVLMLTLSTLALHMFNIPVERGGPDLVGLALLLLIVVALLGAARVARYLVTSYLVLALPVLLGIFVWWLYFNRGLPGPRMQLYLWPGYVPLGLSTAVLAAALAALYLRARSVPGPLAAALILWWLSLMPPALDESPMTSWARIPLGAAVAVDVPRWALVVAVAKVLGFAVMIYSTFLLLLTTRDAEVAGALRQLGVPYRASFYASLVFRNLDTVMADYTNIRNAQVARGAMVARRGPLARLADLARISVPLVASMIRRSVEMGIALYARGFYSATRITEYRERRPFTYVDWAVVALLAALAVFDVVLGYRFDSMLRLAGYG
jgi:energy-coupling factor transporter transmembrane protein EcfT